MDELLPPPTEEDAGLDLLNVKAPTEEHAGLDMLNVKTPRVEDSGLDLLNVKTPRVEDSGLDLLNVKTPRVEDAGLELLNVKAAVLDQWRRFGARMNLSTDSEIALLLLNRFVVVLLYKQGLKKKLIVI